MAYQVRQRDPLLDSNMQAAIERRGKELLGIVLVAAGVLVSMMLASYSVDDPGWLTNTDMGVQNWLGRFGAAIASPLYVIVGAGAWGIALVFLAWGLRFVLHIGEERWMGRLVFSPIAIAIASVYASTLIPGAGWSHSFGMGGLFGDTVLGAILSVLPVGAAFGLKVMTVIAFAGGAAMMLFVMGFDRFELRRFLRFMTVSLIMVYAQAMTLMGRGAVGGARAAAALHQRQKERKAARLAAGESVDFDDQMPNQYQQGAPAAPVQREEKTGLLARMPSLVKRPAAPAPAQEVPADHGGDIVVDGDDRIRAKISDVIKSRALQRPVMTAQRPEPPVVSRSVPSAPAPVRPQQAAPAPQARTYSDTEGSVIERGPSVPQPAYVPPTPEHRKVVQHTPRKAPAPSRQARAEAQPALQFDDPAAAYEHPPLSLLTNPVSIERHHLSDEALEENARMLENVLDDYGVKGEIVSVRPGPVVTMYELEPAPGLKASRVIGLADDIARSMSALSARVSTVPGRSVIGIELPNEHREKVVLREILAARDFGDSNMRLPLALGKDIGGDPIVANLAKMPHLLIAGTTGSGKSVAINTMILSLLYKLSPEECRLIMIDPKMLELSVYDGIPHLLSPVVTDPKKAVVALKWVVGEMEERYRKMSKMGVRNIEGYNGRVREAQSKGEMFSRTVQTGFDDDTGEPIFETEEFLPQTIPYIVVIVDEMADLMMVAGKEIEACIQRLAQMARASGIHLIMATQRPSVDVITGTIKANFPTRISFQVTGKIDSRTILGEQGAEQLLGMGDMLYMAGGAKITRVHGPFCSDEEVEEIVNYLKSFGPPEYMSGVVDGPDEDKESDIDLVLGLGGNTDGEDALYDQAVAIVIKDRKCSTSYIQRKLAIGYNKAARLVEEMEDQGLVSAANHVGKREILVPEK